MPARPARPRFRLLPDWLGCRDHAAGPVIIELNLFTGLSEDFIRPEDMALYQTQLLARLKRLYAEHPPLFRAWAAARAVGAALLAGLIALLLWLAAG